MRIIATIPPTPRYIFSSSAFSKHRGLRAHTSTDSFGSAWLDGFRSALKLQRSGRQLAAKSPLVPAPPAVIAAATEQENRQHNNHDNE